MSEKKTRRALRPDVNPYRFRVHSYPGRIFTFENAEVDQEALVNLCTNAGKLICEIGSGAGNHLVEVAKRNPGTCCVGFEYRFKRAVRTLEKAEKKGVSNVYVVRGDWHDYSGLLPPASIDGMYINFPDPWEKRRQQKHRLLSLDLLEKLGGLLRKGGFVSIKTDHESYFQDFLKLLETNKTFSLVESTTNLANSEFAATSIATEFEQLFLAQKLPIFYLKLIRR